MRSPVARMVSKCSYVSRRCPFLPDGNKPHIVSPRWRNSTVISLSFSSRLLPQDGFDPTLFYIRLYKSSAPVFEAQSECWKPSSGATGTEPCSIHRVHQLMLLLDMGPVLLCAFDADELISHLVCASMRLVLVM